VETDASGKVRLKKSIVCGMPSSDRTMAFHHDPSRQRAGHRWPASAVLQPLHLSVTRAGCTGRRLPTGDPELLFLSILVGFPGDVAQT
jgi:hypothetical protein